MGKRERVSVARQQGRSLGVCLFRAALTLWFGGLLIVAVAGLGFLGYGARYSGRIYEGVTIQGVSVGGLFPKEALALVRERLMESLPYVSLHVGERNWTLSIRDLGGYLDLEESVQEAWSLGRSGDFREDVRTRLELLWWGYRVVPDFHLEPGPGLPYFRQIAGEAGHPVRRAELLVAGLQARAAESVVGRELDIRATREGIEEKVRETLGASSWGRVSRAERLWRQELPEAGPFPVKPISSPLLFREIVPPLTEVAGAKERVRTILGSPLVLRFDFPEIEADGATTIVPRRWSIDQAVLASWMTLRQVQGDDGLVVQVDVDEEMVKALLPRLADEISRAPREARFDYDPATGFLTTLTPGQNGYALDIAATQGLIAEACVSPQREVVLPVTVVPPRVTRADLEGLLPLSLISVGESSFKGSRPGRLQNIHVATARFNGLVIPAHTTFSFLENLGAVTVANGYSQSWIIYGDRTVLGPGGGVCQVSTTFFRAAFWGGYPIITRWPHTYRVSWYEPPIGLDAAVFSSPVDVRFANDTDAPILILTEVDEENAALYFRFYGRSPDRQVSMEGPVTSNPVKAGDAIVEEDPSLAPAERVQVEWAHDGIDVTLYRVIEEDGQVLAREKFFSRYDPWPARYRVGPARETPTPPEHPD